MKTRKRLKAATKKSKIPVVCRNFVSGTLNYLIGTSQANRIRKYKMQVPDFTGSCLMSALASLENAVRVCVRIRSLQINGKR